MRAFTISLLICGSFVGCVSFGPADGQFYATGSTPSGSSCILSLTAVGSSAAATERIVSSTFRESFIVGPDLSMELVANQAVSPGWMVSGSDQFRRTVAGGL